MARDNLHRANPGPEEPITPEYNSQNIINARRYELTIPPEYRTHPLISGRFFYACIRTCCVPLLAMREPGNT